MFSVKSKKTVDACRFCCMCRHLCPLGLALGKELNNPRAKALLLSLVEKGALELSETAADIYECCLCNACASNCETGYEPAVFIREIRSSLVAQGLAPAPVMKVIDGLLEYGNVYETPAAETLNGYTLPDRGHQDTLLYVGALAALKNRPMVEAVMHLLDKAGIGYNVFAENLSTGSLEYDLIGEVQEVRDIAAACAQALNAYGAKRILVLNPSDARMLKQEYANWDIPLNADVCTATSFMDELIQQRKLKLSPAQGCVTYHDAARLSRDLQETEPARRLIQAMGYTIHEMWQSRDLTRSTGGEALASYAPEIILKTAACRMEDAAGTNAEMLICACPASEANLDGIPGMPVADLFVLLDRQSTPQA